MKKLIALLLLVLSGCSTPELKTIEGRVVVINPTWTMNGDGSIVIVAELPRIKARMTVHVVGSPSSQPETQLSMRVNYIQELLDHRVRVVGIVDSSDGSLIARSITELCDPKK